MDQKVAEKFAQALAECAVRQNHAGLRKEAAAYQLIKQSDAMQASPYIYGPAIGALLGGAGGYFSDDDEKKKLRNLLYGVSIGGLSGLGVAGFNQLLSHYMRGSTGGPAADGKAPELGVPVAALQNDPAVIAAAGGQPAAPRSHRPGPGSAASSKNVGTSDSGQAFNTALATASGVAAGAVSPPKKRYNIGEHARNLRPFLRPAKAQQTLAEILENLHNRVQQAGPGGLTDRQLVGGKALKNPQQPLREGQKHQVELMRKLIDGADYRTFSEAVPRIPAGLRGNVNIGAEQITRKMHAAGHRTPVSKRIGFGGLGGLLAGLATDQLQASGLPQTIGDYAGTLYAQNNANLPNQSQSGGRVSARRGSAKVNRKAGPSKK